LEKAAMIYSLLITTRKKMSFYGSYTSEDIIFGENTAVAIVMIALSAEKVGEIIHTNDEVGRVFGYKRREMIGQKVNILNPLPIAKVHDRFLRNFLETAQRHVIDNVR
jgi:PAS domain S-box-containing protein